MLQFLGAAAITFLLCWIWVGGYLADFVVWLVSKFTPESSNEQNLAYAIGGGFLVLGIIAAVSTADAGSALGGLIAGAGLYVAVRLPNKIRGDRLDKAAKTWAAGQPEDQPE